MDTIGKVILQVDLPAEILILMILFCVAVLWRGQSECEGRPASAPAGQHVGPGLVQHLRPAGALPQQTLSGRHRKHEKPGNLLFLILYCSLIFN